MFPRIYIWLFFLIFLNGCTTSSKYEVIYNGEKGQEQEQSEINHQDYTIAIVPKVTGIPYFNAVEEGAVEAGYDLDVNVLYSGPLIADWKQQETIINHYIEQNVDLIAVSANDPEKLGPVLKKASLKGIRVITWDSDTNKHYREMFINMVDPEVLGRHIMDTLSSRVNEQGSYAIITGASDAANLNEWIEWMKLHQKENYPNMTLVDIVESNDDPKQAYKAATDLVKKYPDLRGIIGSSSVGPPAASQAVQDADKAGDITVVGLSTPNLMREYIKEGSSQVVTLWSPKKLGYLTVSVAKELLDSKEIQDNQYISNIGNIRVKEDTVIMGQPIDFTKENIDQYDF
ncbi:autoinducer 2 ABC transporter substrate-binding protein [Metabacillus halosaccharovorans]|uniref:Autoinducer 2 ABC transporter substrate-binding protein n=1 Tax=Metabacillus halosaccharovorans TaxID=930124 RepID=A0ABT3DEC0_9BACI|nr:autoinducer 2 ABC transporter substrate-binding protein [Metabacillus halosaccharovorans]MCV9885410.1 autoinducer 2 ABC transporter substrate-binding protein [Metabacillus halosaccharovorans]